MTPLEMINNQRRERLREAATLRQHLADEITQLRNDADEEFGEGAEWPAETQERWNDLNAEYEQARTNEKAAERALERLTAGGGDLPGQGVDLGLRTTDGAVVRCYGPEDRLEVRSARHGFDREPIGDYEFGETLLAITRGEQTRSANIEGSDSAGGVFVNPELSARFIDLARAQSRVVQAGAQTAIMQSSSMDIVRQDADPTVGWYREMEAAKASAAVFSKIVLRAKRLHAIVPISEELAEDSTNAQAVIQNAAVAAMAGELDRAALIGDGSNAEPLGVVNTPGVNAIGAVGTPADYSHITQAVEAILLANYAGSVNALAWIHNPRDAATYNGLTDSTGQPLQPTPWAAQVQRLPTTKLEPNSGETQMIIGSFREVLIGVRVQTQVRLLTEATLEEEGGGTINLASQYARALSIVTRADVAVQRPAFFSVLNGVTVS